MDRKPRIYTDRDTQSIVDGFRSFHQVRRSQYEILLLELVLSPLIAAQPNEFQQRKRIPMPSRMDYGPDSQRQQAGFNGARPNSGTEPDVDEDDDDQEFHKVDTYSDYKPSKVNIGHPHPDPVVETISLATVEPPDITYKLHLPHRIISEGLLSSLQLESVIYASQQHSQMNPDNRTRRGFLIGDGAGVGKGRTVAGIIYENYLNGRRKSIWLSVSADLKLDAERDLNDIGAKIPVFLLGREKYGNPIGANRGVVFTTYSGLISKSSTIEGCYGSRLGQLISWAGKNFDGVIIFDECHKAKNITMPRDDAKKKITQTAEHVLKLQEALPLARIVYASATGATETRHLGYMTRLGIWGPGTGYPTFSNFCVGIERRGVSAMELVAVELKKRGSYIARQLSFKTTTFRIERAPLTYEFIKLYDECVDMWKLALEYFIEAEGYIEGDTRKKKIAAMKSTFWGAHQRFFKYLCISLKVPKVVKIAKRAIEEGKCVVIGLQSTGEARTLDAIDTTDIEDFVSTARETFISLIENSFPAPPRDHREAQREARRRACEKVARVRTVYLDSDGSDVEIIEPEARDADVNNNSNRPQLNADGQVDDPPARLLEMQRQLYAKIDQLGPRLPDNTLDDLIYRLGGAEKVAEMTGRKFRLLKDSNGKVTYHARNETDTSESLNIEEKKRFMRGDKLIAIISEAASSGVSLQADKRVMNQRRRVHITIELPWSADRAIQQFGRTHRSNQVSGPEYVFIISDLCGEVRFASTVARRLESLGAITHGDRRAATEQRDISEFNIGADYCKIALGFINDAIDPELPYYYDNIKPNYQGDFVKDTRDAYSAVGLESWLCSSAAAFQGRSAEKLMNIFLNRILGMKVRVQNALFDLFSRYVDRLILLDKRAGLHERGILEVNTSSGMVRADAPEDLAIKTNAGIIHCRLRNIEVDRGITWERATELYRLDDGGDEKSGFYKHKYSDIVKLVIGEGVNQYRIHRPNLGTESRFSNWHNIRTGSDKISVEQAEPLWRSYHFRTGRECSHEIYANHCEERMMMRACDRGMRIRCYCILSGAILTTMPYLSRRVPKVFDKLHIMRLRLDENTREIGPYLQRQADDVRAALRMAQQDGIYWDQESAQFDPAYL